MICRALPRLRAPLLPRRLLMHEQMVASCPKCPGSIHHSLMHELAGPRR